MPWKVDSVVEARQAFINDWLQRKHHMAFSAICAKHGITRQLGYKWVERFREGGMANLVDRSRAPIHPLWEAERRSWIRAGGRRRLPGVGEKA